MIIRRERRQRRVGFRVSNEWQIIYCDLMTNLMLFFLMLFAFTRLSADDRSKVHESIKKDFTTISEKSLFKQVLKVEKKAQDKISELMTQLTGMSEMPKISVTEEYISIQLPAPVLFDFGMVSLKEQGKEVLGMISEILRPIPQQIVVEGHTDDRPLTENAKYFSNWELSGARALSAVNYLIEKEISPQRLSAIAYGPHHPLAPNDTDEGRAKNRRIEINIVRQK